MALLPAILAVLPDNGARAHYCKQRAEELMTQYYQGQQEQIDRLVNGNSRSWRLRYGNYNKETLEILGMKMWSNSIRSQEILADQFMFLTWANLYATFREYNTPVSELSDTNRHT